MRTTQEVLDFIDEQLWYIKTEFKDNGLKPPILATIGSESTKNILEQKYWLYQSIKWFINEDI